MVSPGRLNSVSKQTLEILDDVKAAAHELHSPRLEYLGIAAILKSFCTEFSEKKGVKIDFSSNGLPSIAVPEISICFFRVLQEALRNGVKHSGVKEFEVQIWGSEDELHLTIHDSGAGFDVTAARSSRGLGLIRMEQRLKLLKGTLSIETQLQRGTTIHACVPLGSGNDGASAGQS